MAIPKSSISTITFLSNPLCQFHHGILFILLYSPLLSSYSFLLSSCSSCPSRFPYFILWKIWWGSADKNPFQVTNQIMSLLIHYLTPQCLLLHLEQRSMSIIWPVRPYLRGLVSIFSYFVSIILSFLYKNNVPFFLSLDYHI